MIDRFGICCTVAQKILGQNLLKQGGNLLRFVLESYGNYRLGYFYVNIINRCGCLHFVYCTIVGIDKVEVYS